MKILVDRKLGVRMSAPYWVLALAGLHGTALASDGAVIYDVGGINTKATGLFFDPANNWTNLAGARLNLNAANTTSGSVGPSLWMAAAPTIDRMNIGWGANFGGNMEVFSKVGSKPGQFSFTYGGAPNTGRLLFTHYNGTTRSDNFEVDYSGNAYVRNKLTASEVVVQSQSGVAWPDYVFKAGYPLMPIEKLHSFIEDKGHLPNFPSADEINKDGVPVGEMSARLLRQIEELTLYVIDLKHQNDTLRERLTKVEVQTSTNSE